MRMGLGIFLIVVGAVLTFAVRDAVSGVDLSMVGWIFMAGGALALLLAIVSHTQATNTKNEQVIERREGPAA